MSEKKKDFLANLLFGAVIAAAVFALNLSRDYAVTRCICDGFFVAAVMLLGVGCIRGVRNRGGFDVMGYGVKTALETALPFLRHGDERETMDDYRARKAEARKSSRGILLAGGLYFALSLVSLAIYHIV